jgi:uncharacterized zinc-type alcohol dehydrogenase-like protein
MADQFRAYASTKTGGELSAFAYDPGPIKPDDVEIKVLSCGICHSDLSMIKNEWGIAKFPIVPGHEVVGTVAAVGSNVTNVKVGQHVGVGWTSKSCMTCRPCMNGNHNLCATAEGILVGRHGGFADRVRIHWGWATAVPDGVDVNKAGPLFCGGITVFNPIVQFGVKPTDRVGVVGIGGLGHLAVKFLNKWGCEVVAFTSEAKRKEAIDLGAHHAVNSRDTKEYDTFAGKLDFIISTVNVTMDWAKLMNCLAPGGRLHFVGAVLEPVPVSAFGLINKQHQVSGTPLGSPATTALMLDFCARHKIAPVTEHFPMSRVNDAIKHLESGQARYRVVLENDFR